MRCIRRVRALVAGAAVLAFVMPFGTAAAASTADVDAAFDAAMSRYRLPGLAIGIVEHGEVVYARTGGEEIAGSGQTISRQTLFKIASVSKSMTTATIARLVDRGLLAWDDPVTKHLPQFRMHDPWVTRQMQVRDLLIHNSGLPAGAGDLMLWPEPNDFTRADIIAGMQYLKPAYSFRSRYAYDNTLYIVAGEVAAAAGGAPYETLVAREVFEPLGMARCRSAEFDRDEVGHVAQPHMQKDGRNVVIREDGATIPTIPSVAAGGIRCSLDDMLKYVGQWLDPSRAVVGGKPWLSDTQRAALWTPQTLMPVSSRMKAWDKAHFHAYGYGWRLADVDGEWKVSHTGTLAGMYTVLTLLPDRKVGFIVMTNGEGDDARTALNQVLVKRYTAPEERVTIESVAFEMAREVEREKPVAAAAKAKPTEPVRRTPAAAAIEAWSEPIDATRRQSVAVDDDVRRKLGVYRDPWFGEASLCVVDGRVEFRAHKSPRLRGALMEVEVPLKGTDTTAARWLVQWDEASIGVEPWIDVVEEKDKPLRLSMAKVDPDGDFSSDFEDLAFERVRPCDDPSSTPAEAGLVDIATLVPDIDLDIRYAGTDNFLGRRVEGYDTPKCFLLKPAAEALAGIERNLRDDGLRLRIFDCYRPRRAVADFVRWAADAGDQRTKAEYYPNLDKSKLLGDYIAPTSGHSRGATLDLTLLECDRKGRRCRALDMGTPFDFFDVRANTDSPAITKRQRANRERLRDAMRASGFENYPLEWWHYTFRPEPSPDRSYDVPVR